MFKIIPLNNNHIDQVLDFTDISIGSRYFSREEITKYIEYSKFKNEICSFGLFDDNNQLVAIRLSFAPGVWISEFEPKHLSKGKWGLASEKVSYFKSLFVANSAQGQGWGPKLSLASIDALKNMGAEAILTHSWKESPNNSSFKYLSKFGFNSITDHPLFWSKIDYDCTRCLKPPCQCTATEMILTL